MHGYYWNDDQPMMYFQNVRDRPRYCASHVGIAAGDQFLRTELTAIMNSPAWRPAAAAITG